MGLRNDWAFKNMAQGDLEKILNAGGALEFSVKKVVMHHGLVDLAACAKRGGSHLTLIDVGHLPVSALVEIAKAGSGHVTFKD